MSMRKRIGAGACVGLMGLCLFMPRPAVAADDPVVLHVATDGNDVWSGMLAAPTVGGTDGPFRTLVRARDCLRELRGQQALDAGATVWVHAGAYFLTETFELTGQDSGTAAGRVVYRAWEGDEVVLVGGAEVTGFEPADGNVMKAELAPLGLEGIRFRQLFFNGQRQILARYPDFDPENPYAGGFLYVEDHVEENSKSAFVAPAEGIHYWANVTDGEVWVFPGVNYWNNIVPIQSVDPESRRVTLAKPASYGINPGDRYFVRGLREELDAPGEWYLDGNTSTLYFYPPAALDNARVSVPRVGTVVSISKDDARQELPEYITLQGFIIEGCDGTALVLKNARHCAVVGCTVRNAGGTGVQVSTGKDCVVYGCDIYQTGSGGVAVYCGNRNPNAPDGNRVENNYIHHTGYFSKNSSAVTVRGVGNTVSHNLVHDCPRIAISYGGNDHVIEYNHLRHMNLETQDSGATYSLGRDWTDRGHIVRYNYVHDTLGYGRHGGKTWHAPFFTFGIYLDDWSSGQHVYGNIVARSFLAGIDVHSGRDNVIENNIIYDCNREQFRYQAWPISHRMLPDMLTKTVTWPHREDYPELARHTDAREDARMSYNTFTRNIISYRGEKAYLYAVSGLDRATTKHDLNLIWRGGDEPDNSLAKLREMGLDKNSVIADPKFADPDRGDFSMPPDSPAFKLGFKPIPFDEIGPYEDARRASWPIVEAEGAREHPHKIHNAVYKPPTFSVPRRHAAVDIDGTLKPEEWNGLDAAKAMMLEQEPNTNTGATPPSVAWLLWDDEALYVGLRNDLKPGSTPIAGTRWGGDDGAEVCMQRGDGKGPIYVLQGFAGGHFQSADHAGAPSVDVERLGQACSFAASVSGDRWTGEWRIPFKAANIPVGPDNTIRFNIGVRKTAGPKPWICWVGTGGPNHQVDRAGLLILSSAP